MLVNTDAQLRGDVIAELAREPAIDATHVAVVVKDGAITVGGHVGSHAEKHALEHVVRRMPGVRALINRIKIQPRLDANEIGAHIIAALKRQALREARQMDVAVEGAVVTLSGKVHSMAEHDVALGVASSIQGVSRVVDRLRVAG